MPELKGFMVPRTPEGRVVDRAGPAVALLGRRPHDRVPRGAGARSRRCFPTASTSPTRTRAPSPSSGRTGSRAATPATELLDPVRSQYKECFVVVRCTWRGEHYSRCVYIWVDKDFALARGWYQGYPKKLGSIWMTRPVTVGRAGPRLEAGGRFGATLAANDRRLAEVSLTLTGPSVTGGFVNALPDAALAVDAVDRPVAARRAERARHDALAGRGARSGLHRRRRRSSCSTRRARSSPRSGRTR